MPPVQAKSPQEEAKTFQLPPGYRMELVLSEPDIKEPVIAVFDGDGRMFVAEMRSYMQEIEGKEELTKTSRVSLHWSSKGDGVYDKHTVFIDNLVLPRMLVALDKGRVIIGETDTNDLFIYTDTDGDGVSDKKEPFYVGGPRGGNLEHQPNGLLWGIDNTLYSTYNNYRLRWTPNGAVKETSRTSSGWPVDRLPAIPSYELSGVVAAVGPMSTRWPSATRCGRSPTSIATAPRLSTRRPRRRSSRQAGDAGPRGERRRPAVRV